MVASGETRAGRAGGLGWSNLVRGRGLVVPRHRATTRHLCSLYPAQTEPGLGHEGIFLGVDELTGGAAFHFDPFWLYTRKQIENPNMLVMGEVGFGKSSFVKCFIYRSIGAFGAPGPAGSPTEGGRWVAVVDPKGEYQPLADALGLQTIRLYPGGPDRVNPLDVGPSDWDRPAELALRRTTMVNALVTVLMKRSLSAVEEAGVAAAIAVLDPARDAEPTLGDVYRLLAHPTAEMATEAELSRAAAGRGVLGGPPGPGPAAEPGPAGHVRRAFHGQDRLGQPRVGPGRVVRAARPRRHGGGDDPGHRLAAGVDGRRPPVLAAQTAGDRGVLGAFAPPTRWRSTCSAAGSCHASTGWPTWPWSIACRTCGPRPTTAPRRPRWPWGCWPTPKPGCVSANPTAR